MVLSQAMTGASQRDFNLYSELASAYHELGIPDPMKFSPGPLTKLAEQTKPLIRHADGIDAMAGCTGALRRR